MAKDLQSGDTGIRRRTALKGIAAAGAVAAIGFPTPLRAKPSQMVITTGGGKLEDGYRAAYFQPWTQKSGIPIVTGPNTAAKLKAMVEQKAVEWDVSQQAAELAATMARQGLLEPIDYGIVDKSKLIDGVAFEHFVMCDVAAYHVAWNTKHVKAGSEPKNWAEFWAFKGRRGLWKRPYQTMEVALMADGVDKDKLYPLDVERALKAMARIKDGIFWWERGAQVAQILIDGEVEVSACWNGRVHEPKLGGAPVDYHLNQALLVCDSWTVPKGAPNKRESMEFIALALEAQHQAKFAQLIPYGPVNKDAMKLVPANVAAALPTAEANFRTSVFLDVNWWADNGDKTGETFNRWITG